jgi:uncharacterized protein (TIGR03000 family)
MNDQRLSRRVIGPVAIALLLLTTQPASAQVSPWGLRVTFGPPTDGRISTGGAYYPGGGGAIVPGYGYAPEYGYNWPTFREAWAMRHSTCAGPAPAPVGLVAPSIPPTVEAPPATALLRVRVLTDAELFIANSPTAQRGELREFVTPPLAGGRNFQYEVRARWRSNGRDVERRKVVGVHPGDRVTVDFLAEDVLPEQLSTLQGPLPRGR